MNEESNMQALAAQHLDYSKKIGLAPRYCKHCWSPRSVVDPIKGHFSLIHQWFSMVIGDISETYQWFVNGFYPRTLREEHGSTDGLFLLILLLLHTTNFFSGH